MKANHFDLTNRVCLVTGSSQGIGLALARGMAAYGAKVYPNGCSRSTLLEHVLAELLKKIRSNIFIPDFFRELPQ